MLKSRDRLIFNMLRTWYLYWNRTLMPVTLGIRWGGISLVQVLVRSDVVQCGILNGMGMLLLLVLLWPRLVKNIYRKYNMLRTVHIRVVITLVHMKALCHKHAFRITGSLRGAFTSPNSGDAGFWCFLFAWSSRWTNSGVADGCVHVMTHMWRHCIIY